MTVSKKIAIVLACLGAGSAGVLFWQNIRVPVLGVEHGKLKPLGTRPNDISSQTHIPEKYVEPLKMKASVEASKSAIKSAAQSYGGERLIEEGDDYLYFVFTTPKMRFHDDVEFLVDPGEGVVHVRSASRAGFSDTGLNLRRYEKIREHYESER